jgi:hypothetical protein
MAAYVRVYQPATPTSAFAQSSYLRLGAYASSDESGLVTGLTTTTSSNSTSSITAISSANSSASTSSETGDQTASVTDTQTGTYTTQNNGVLAFTYQDFQANVQGAALMKIGNGHTTEVTAGDAKYQVDGGGYTLNAANNIKINAGYNGTPANLQLTASDYIKQTANGPLSVITYGNSDTQTIGDSASFFLGTKFSCTIGTDMSLSLSVSLSMFLGYQISISMCSLSLNLVFNNSFIWGSQIQLQTGIYFKQVAGSYINIVVGPDIKTANSSAKFLETSDYKYAPVSDIKVVGVNGTICETKVEIEWAKVDWNKGLSAEQQGLMTKIEDIASRTGSFELRTKGSLIHM